MAIHGHFGWPEHCIFRLGQGVLSYTYVFMYDFLPLTQRGTTVVISRLVPWTTKSSKRGLKEHLRKVRGARSSLCLTYFRYKVDFILLFANMDGWISGRWANDDERLSAMEPHLRLRRFRLERGLNPGPLD